MGRQVVHNGIIYEDLGNGQARVIGPASQPPMNPEFPYKGPQAEANLSQTGAQTGKTVVDTRKTAQDMRQSAELFGPQKREQEAKAQLAEILAQQKQQEVAQQAQQEQLRQAASSLGNDEALAAIQRARGLTNGWSTGFPGQMLGHIGGTDARDLQTQLNTVAAATTLDKLMAMKSQSANGASGMGALSEREGALLRDSVAGLDQTQSQDRLRQGLDTVEDHYRRLAAINHGGNPTDPGVQLQYGIDPRHKPQQIAAQALQNQYRDYTKMTRTLPPRARQIGLDKLSNDPRIQRLWGIVNGVPAPRKSDPAIDSLLKKYGVK